MGIYLLYGAFWQTLRFHFSFTSAFEFIIGLDKDFCSLLVVFRLFYTNTELLISHVQEFCY